MSTLDHVLDLARRLSHRDKLRLLQLISPHSEPERGLNGPVARNSLYGILQPSGPAPSEEDIAAMREEAWPAHRGKTA